MPAEKTKFLVGLFLIIGGTICLTLFIYLGASKFFEKGYTLVTYFDESGQGLNMDAPVKYRGVPIGRVTDIKVAPDYQLVEVAMKIDKDYQFQKNGTQSLVASLKNIGITGSMYIEMNRVPKEQLQQTPQITFHTDFPVIPSRPSNVTRMIDNLEQTINNINQFDVSGISNRIKITLDHFNHFLDQTDPKKLSTNLEHILSGMDALVNDSQWDKLLNVTTHTGRKIGLMTDQLSEDVTSLKSFLETLEGGLKDNKEVLSSTLQHLNATTDTANHLMRESRLFVEQERIEMKNLHHQLSEISHNLHMMSEGLVQLVGSIQNQPSRMLFSKPPQPRKIEGKK